MLVHASCEIPTISFLSEYVEAAVIESCLKNSELVSGEIPSSLHRELYEYAFLCLIPSLWIHEQAYASFCIDSKREFPVSTFESLKITTISELRERFGEVFNSIDLNIRLTAKKVARALSRLKQHNVESKIERINLLGDQHDEGIVFSVTDKRGSKKIIKNRAIQGESFWANFCDWLVLSGAPSECKSPQMIQIEPDLCSFEYIHNLPITCPAEYYRSCGFLLFFMWLFGARDIVRSNVIASTLGPHLIDAETLFYPSAKTDFRPKDTGMLPIPQNAYCRGKTVITSAIATSSSGVTYAPNFRRNECDDFCYQIEGIRTQDIQNIPTFNNSMVGHERFNDDICEGFKEGFRWSSEMKKELREVIIDTAPLVSRFVFRPTAVYGITILKSLEKNSMKKINLPSLNKSAMALLTDQQYQLILREESRAMSNLLIPKFSIKSHSEKCVVAGIGSINGLRSGVLTSISRLDELNERLMDGLVSEIKKTLIKSNRVPMTD